MCAPDLPSCLTITTFANFRFARTLTESLNGSRRSSSQIEFSVVLIAGGAVIAGASDFEFAPLSYAMAIASCCLNAMYLTSVKKKSANFTNEEILFVNSVIPVPLILGFVGLSGELQDVTTFPRLWEPKFLLTLAGSTMMGSSLGYTQCRCTAVSSDRLGCSLTALKLLSLCLCVSVAVFLPLY